MLAKAVEFLEYLVSPSVKGEPARTSLAQFAMSVNFTKPLLLWGFIVVFFFIQSISFVFSQVSMTLNQANNSRWLLVVFYTTEIEWHA